MAILSPEQILIITTKAGVHPEIDGAVKEERRARLHTEPAIRGNAARTDFMQWVRTLIDKNKFDIFEHLMTDPIATIDVTESIFNEVKKVFEAQDRYIGYQFINEDLKKDFELYLKKLDDDSFWRTTGMQGIKNSYNSFIIVDLPGIEEQGQDPNGIVTGRPQPYYYLLPIEKVMQVQINDHTKKPEFIFFKDCYRENYAYLFDDAFFRSFKRNDQGQWIQLSESAHGLGFTPAKQFWSTKMSGDSELRKRGLLSASLGNLDSLLFKIVSEKHVELYAEYPIMTMFSQKCDYRDPEGNECDGGQIRRLMKSDGLAGNRLTDTFETCPKCNGGVTSLGAGSIFEAPAMSKSDDPNMIDAVKFVSIQVDALKWINQKVSDQKNALTFSIIGVVDEVSGVAINKDQVLSQYESRQNVLMDIKNQLEDIHRWTHETLGRLRYGKAFVSATINYGTKFFLQTTAQLNDRYLKSREGGIPSFELANQRNQIYETQYRSNPEMLQRVRILMNIEPYQDYSIAQIKDLMSIPGIFDKRLLALKIDFDNYILRFERDYTDLISFMQFSPFNTKIDMITGILLSYVDEAMALNAPIPATPPLILPVPPVNPPV